MLHASIGKSRENKKEVIKTTILRARYVDHKLRLNRQMVLFDVYSQGCTWPEVTTELVPNACITLQNTAFVCLKKRK